jgi:hypothetical protein
VIADRLHLEQNIVTVTCRECNPEEPAREPSDIQSAVLTQRAPGRRAARVLTQARQDRGGDCAAGLNRRPAAPIFCTWRRHAARKNAEVLRRVGTVHDPWLDGAKEGAPGGSP